MVFLKDLAFAICDKIAATISCESNWFSLDFKGERSWKNKMLSSKSVHHILPRPICGFFTHPPEDIIECGSSEPPKIAFSAFLCSSQGCTELGDEQMLPSFILPDLNFHFRKRNQHWCSKGPQATFQPSPPASQWSTLLGPAAALSGGCKGSLAALADTDTIVQWFWMQELAAWISPLEINKPAEVFCLPVLGSDWKRGNLG